jgi:hypothetical protein
LFAAWTVLGLIHHVFSGRTQVNDAFLYVSSFSVTPGIVCAMLVVYSNHASRQQSPTSEPVPLVHRLAEPLLRRVSVSVRTLLRSGSVIASPRATLVLARRQATAIGLVAGLVAFALLVVIPVLLTGSLPHDVAGVWAAYFAAVTVLMSPWGGYQLARAWFSAQRELPYRLMDFLDDAHQLGILRLSGSVYQFRNSAIQDYFSDPARRLAIMETINELTDWVLGDLEIRDAYEGVGAERGDIEQAVNSVATESVRAGRVFTFDAVTSQAVLEQVRLRLNELGHRSVFSTSLRAQQATGLGAVLDPSKVILTQTMDSLGRLIDRLPSASVGISGIRGIGKSTLIRWLCTEKSTTGLVPTLGVYVTAPVEYDAREFLIHLYVTLCKAVLEDNRLKVRKPRRYPDSRRITVALILGIVAAGFLLHRTVARLRMYTWSHAHAALWPTAATALLVAALMILASTTVRNPLRRRRADRTRSSVPVEAAARDRLRHLRYQITETLGQSGTIKAPLGMALGGSRSRAVTENQMTLPELVDSYRDFAESVVNALQELARQEGALAMSQVRLIVGIDEIDRIENGENAEKFLNDIKAIFGIPSCCYVASVSADALAIFERRAVSARTAFDTTFDAIIRIGPLELRTARQVLERRVVGLSYPFIALCYVLSGGVPRELMRIARSIFDVRNGTSFSAEREVSCEIIVTQVISHEMGALRQGLLPLAAQLAVPGASELIGLLDDPDWPSGNVQEDLARMSKLFSQRTLFEDETGNVAAAAKVCDSLGAAIYFLLSTEEAFTTHLDQIVTDLAAYDSEPDRKPDHVGAIHMLARARAVLPVNPALAVNRVRASRQKYALTDIAPTLLSQTTADTEE